MRPLFLISGSIAGMFFGEIYPAIILAAILHNLAIKLNTGIKITKSKRYKLIKATIQIMVAIAKADGVFTKKELTYIKNFLNFYFKVNDAEYTWYLKQMKKLTYRKNHSLKTAFNTIRVNSHLYEKKFFLNCFSELAATSSVLRNNQKKIIRLYSKHVGISYYRTNKTWKKIITKPKSHYEILGAYPNMNLNEIRNKYIENAKFYHPDRYRNRSAAEQKFANDKMQKLNEAWNTILTEKK